MFPAKQFFKLESFNPAFMQESVVGDNGVVTSKLVKACDVSLPDSSMFDLKNLLEAKVDLKSVSCRLISSSVPSFDSIGTKEEVEAISNFNKKNDDSNKGE